MRLTFYRLVFRGLSYPDGTRGPLPLPPKSVWNIQLSGDPKRVKGPNHDMIVVEYTFSTHLLTPANGPASVEPALAAIGGTWTEKFNLPTDPDMLLERTGYACMDEDEYPTPSVFEENAYYFFDDTCVAGKNACHITKTPPESCVQSLTEHTGLTKSAITFTRVPWNKDLADRVRVGTITNPNGADLKVLPEDMVDEQRIIYRYFGPQSCEAQEGVITKNGWRRLLMFSATVENNGSDMIHIGVVNDLNSPWQKAHIFEWGACHKHYHFSHYGVFSYGTAPGSKRAFCLEDTNRFHNDETTPLKAVHQSCGFQGITQGWGDEYQFGLPGQWVDITDIDTTTPQALTFLSNKDGFLCEGKQINDAAGNPLFEQTAFKTAQGDVVSRVQCNRLPTWQSDNTGSVQVSSPGGSFVTEACTRGQIGPHRNCGFAEVKPTLHKCKAGTPVHLSCKSDGKPQILRICERSEALGVGVACTLADAASNKMIATTATPVTFACPAVRDAATATTGGYAAYHAAIISAENTNTITCTGAQW